MKAISNYRDLVDHLALRKKPLIEIRCLQKGAPPPHRYSQWVWLPPDSEFDQDRREFFDELFGPHLQWRTGHKVNRIILRRYLRIFEIKVPKRHENSLPHAVWDIDQTGVNYFRTSNSPTSYSFAFLSENDAILAQAAIASE